MTDDLNLDLRLRRWADLERARRTLGSSNDPRRIAEAGRLYLWAKAEIERLALEMNDEQNDEEGETDG